MSKICITRIQQEIMQTQEEQSQQETQIETHEQQEPHQQMCQEEEAGDKMIHKERFCHFITSKYLAKPTTSCATSLKSGKLLFNIISNNKSSEIDLLSKPQLAKLKSKIKIRNFCLMVNDSNTTVLAQKVEKRQRGENNKLVSLIPAVFVVKEVAFIENFYELL